MMEAEMDEWRNRFLKQFAYLRGRGWLTASHWPRAISTTASNSPGSRLANAWCDG